MGLRNPWKLSFDRMTGDLFIADVGQGSREEVNFQAVGDTTLRNYGWDHMEGTACHEPNPGCQTSGLTLPIIEYTHANGCSITGGHRYRGPQSSLQGQYFYGDFCNGKVWSATFNGSSWTFAELTDTTYMISSFGEDDAGELYVADYSGTAIYRIVSSDDFDADGVNDVGDNCPPIANAGQQDADFDLLGDPCEALYGTVNGDSDSDDDGCLDGWESRPLTYAPSVGGDRDPTSSWDFYDVGVNRGVAGAGDEDFARDGTINFQDALIILDHFGHNGSDQHDSDLDRGLPNENKPWRTDEETVHGDSVTFNDVLINLKSFGHTCRP
jgi:hypothetical protein